MATPPSAAWPSEWPRPIVVPPPARPDQQLRPRARHCYRESRGCPLLATSALSAKPRAISCPFLRGSVLAVSREQGVPRLRGGARGIVSREPRRGGARAAVSRELRARRRSPARSLTLTWSPAMDPPRTGRSLRGRGRPPAGTQRPGHRLTLFAAERRSPRPRESLRGRAAPSPPRCPLPPGGYLFRAPNGCCEVYYCVLFPLTLAWQSVLCASCCMKSRVSYLRW